MSKISETARIGTHRFLHRTNDLVGEDGQTTSLRPQTGQVLAVLLERRGDVVAKDDLIAEVWPDTHVTDDSLVQCISEIRRALGETDAKLLRTIPKRGYVLHECPPGNSPLPPGRGRNLTPAASPPGRWLLLVLPVLLLAAIGALAAYSLRDDGGELETTLRLDAPRVAVLPFRSLGGADESYFSDGLTEELTTALTKVSGLFVISPSSVLDFRDTEAPLSEIAQAVGAGYIVEGSVRRASGRIRINAHMTDTGTGARIWSDRYERPLRDVFALQDDLVRQIVAALSVELKAGEIAELSAAGTVDPEAYDLLLRGLEHYRRFNAQDNLAARAYFQKAIGIDPDFARAYADLALTHVWELVLRPVPDPASQVHEALQLARHALSLGPDDPHANFAASIVYRTLRRNAEAVAAAKRVIDVNPSGADGYALLAQAYNFSETPDPGRAAIEMAIRLNPRTPAMYTFIRGQSLYAQGAFGDALAVLEAGVRQNPDFLPARKLLAATYVALDRLEAAEWEAGEILVRDGAFPVEQERFATPFVEDGKFADYTARLRTAGVVR